jgi:hypothetical protein
VYDVVVCGGGTAGAVAAISAARAGAKTAVFDSLSSLGGTQAHAYVTPLMPNHIDGFSLSRGLNLEILEAQNQLRPKGDLDKGEEWYDPTSLGLVLDRLALEAGVTCLFNATLVHVSDAERKVLSVEVMARGSKLTLEGKCFMDCTGDAELSTMAGAEVMAGNEKGEHQPMTLRFFMGGVDIAALRATEASILRLNTPDYVECGYHDAAEGALGSRVARAIEDKILEVGDLGYFQFFSVNGRPGELAFNTPRISGLDPLDPYEISRAYQIGREKIYRIEQFLKNYVQGFARAYVSAIAPLIGIRESRRVVGDYVLTEDDHQSCRKFEDVVARNRYPVDIHLKTGTDYRKFPPGEWHDIPYRSLVVKGFDNLWVAGRCLSADFVAQSAVRIQPVCRAMGEAAGIAAALCAKSGSSSRRLPVETLQALLDLRVP